MNWSSLFGRKPPRRYTAVKTILAVGAALMFVDNIPALVRYIRMERM